MDRQFANHITEENILKGDCGIESCPIALALEGELPEGWKINVMQDYISVFDKEMHETQYVNTEFVTRWIQTFDEMATRMFGGYLGVDDDGNDLDIDDFKENLLYQAPPFKIVLTKAVNEDGFPVRWAKEVL
jgi:hypothetical protein